VNIKRTVVAVCAAVMLTGGVRAENYASGDHPFTPLTIAIASPVQLAFANYNVYGIKTDLFYGQAFNTYGIDVGMVARTRNRLVGVEAGVFGWVDSGAAAIMVNALGSSVGEDAWGLELAGLATVNLCGFYGIEAAVVNWVTEFGGLQFGVVNYDVSYSGGLQVSAYNWDLESFGGAAVGAINFAKDFTGLQLGAINMAEGEMNGLQLGIVNCANLLSGVQIGGINLACNAAVPTLPFINAAF